MSDEATTTPADAGNQQAPAEPNFGEQFEDLSNRVNTVLERLPEPDQTPPVTDPATLMAPQYDDEELDYDEDELEPDYAAGYDPEPQVDPRVAALEEWAIQREQADAASRLQGLGDKHPELREPETLSKVRAELDKITDDPALRANPNLVERVFLSIKAEADASASSTEEAEPTGAALETNATGGAPSEFDPDQAFVDAFGSGREESIF